MMVISTDGQLNVPYATTIQYTYSYLAKHNKETFLAQNCRESNNHC